MSKERVRATVEEHFRRWAKEDREGWLSLFHRDVVIDDPLGQPTMHGLVGAAIVYDRARGFTVAPVLMQVHDSEAAVVVTNVGDFKGQHTVITTIEIWTVNDEGLITGLRVFPYTTSTLFPMPS
jgi:ketosteroid isomerase-like protein